MTEHTIEIPSDWGNTPTSPSPSSRARSTTNTPLFLSEFDPLEAATPPPPPPPQSPPPPPPPSSSKPSSSSRGPVPPPKSSPERGEAPGGMLSSIAASFKRRPRVEGEGAGSTQGSEGEGSDTGRVQQGGGGGANKKKDQQATSFDFPRFLEQLKSRSAEPVAKYLKSFLTNFAKKTFTMNEMIKLVHDFLKFISARMKECEPWKSHSEVEFENSLDCMEKLVMNRLYPFTFTPQIALMNPSSPITTDDLERDAVLRQRIRLFGWVEGRHLDVIDHDPDEEEEESVVVEGEKKEEAEEGEGADVEETKQSGEAVAASRRGGSSKSRNEEGKGVQGFLDFAGSELLKINHYKAPRDKLICILNCCKVIFGLMRHLAGAKGSQGGADAFIPILIFVVLKSNPEHLISNVEYINRFRSASKLQSEAGYYLSSLMGSITFIEAMDHSSLSNITKEEFDAQVSHSISLLPPPTPPTHSASPSSQHPSTLQPFSHTDTGEEPALPISSTASSSLQNMERFFLRTGEAVSRPLNAIGKIFSDALDGPADPPSGSYRIGGDSHGHGHEGGGGLGPGGGVPYAYEARRRSPRPRSFIGLPPTSNDQQQYYPQQQQQGNQNQGTWRGETAPGVQPWREPPPGLGGEEEEGEIDFERLQVELDKRDELARDASLQTLSQIFPNLDADLASLILDTKQGDLPSSIDALLEMGTT
ncbi:hypothetical protein BDY24DRAFT_414133 [Mrakia frigida]|uniref:guanine nucleotide exchange factor VPS9 n=1 Tax=Mrakia frigida TaxID=29902 RepID=UPI003FCC00F0